MGILRRYVLASMVVGLALPTGFATVSLLPLSARAASRPPIIVTDPDAVVLGRTLTDWTALWLRWAFATPASALPEGCLPGQCYSAFNDPTGAYAEAFNPGPIFLWTATPTPSATTCGTIPVRTVNVPEGVPILFPINSMEDTEGPNGKYPPLIPPTISDFVPPHTYAEEVKTVVSASSWTNVTMSVDCNPVANLQESIITEFSAGVVAQGSEGQVFFTGPPGLPVGAELFPTGTAGYWVIVEGLTPGRHTVSVSATFLNPYFNCTGSKCTSMHTESICVSNTPPCH
jgi:hypothetical protein